MMYRRSLVNCDFPSRIEGWLNVCDHEAMAGLLKSRNRGRHQAKSADSVWKACYCVLLQDERSFTHFPTEELSLGDRYFVDLPRVRLDGGRQAFRRRWGYDSTIPRHPPLPEEQEEEDSSELSETTSLRDERLLRFSSIETSYEKACSDRRGSAPATPVLGLRTMDVTSQSRFANFFSKRSFKSNPLKRTKSVTKLERKRCTIDADSIPPSRLRSSRSHESLLQSSPSALATLDLSHGDVQVSALHCSLLGQENCFQMVSNGGIRFYTCRTKEERDRWLYSLKKTIQPNQDSVRRKENILRIWILEAKGIVAKKCKFYCELCLDKTLYARTSSKQKSDMCFWGEHFEFSNLPNVEKINVNLYREADKKKRRDKNVLIGSVHIPVSSVNERHLLEKWYPVITEKNVSGRDIPYIRIKSRFQTVEILPLVVYKDLLMYLKANYKVLCEMLEPVISVRAKEDFATVLINIMQKENMAKEFLSDLVMSDIEKIGDLRLTFRGNSLATKATEAYMKLLGDKYLQETLGTFLRMALEGVDDCEVDPMKMTNNTTLQHQQSNLMTYVEMVWVKIINSANTFPSELQEVFHEFRTRLSSIAKEELSEHIISASIFLRFLCPAILSPSLFNLSQEYPQGKAARNLTLVAKTIQTLANFTRFGGKESFMEFMNGFVEKEWTTMKSFLRQISSPSSKEFIRRADFEGYIDIGKELAVLHNLLVEALTKINKKCYFEQVEKLQCILDSISIALAQPPAFFKAQMLTQNSNTSPRKELKITPQKVSNTHNNDDCNKHETSQIEIKKELVHINSNIEARNCDKQCHPFSSLNTQKSSLSSSTGNRPSTLPRNAYLMGSAKRPAADLSTSDDYVLYSAFDTDLVPANSKDQKIALRNSSMKRDNSLYYKLIHTSGETLKNNMLTSNSPSGNINDINANPNKICNVRNETDVDNANKNVMGIKSVLSNNSKYTNININEAAKGKRKNENSECHDEDYANSSGEMEINNAKGSQISIGQLSTVASSGYQSFPYSQSNSPVDLTYQHDGNAALTTSASHALAFNNPMYHFPTSSTWHNCNLKDKTHHKHLRLSQLSACGSLSAEDISMLCRPSLDNADPTAILPLNGCCCSSSSSGSISCNSTPPAERRNSQFKSTAPRTNPRYSGSLHPCRNVCMSCSPRLCSRALSHPIRSERSHPNKNTPCAATLFCRKTQTKNGLSSHHPKLNLNLNIVDILENNNVKSASCNVVAPLTIEIDNRKNANIESSVKTPKDYEKEVDELRIQMLNLQAKLSDAETKLYKQETMTEKVVADWQARLEAGEERIRKQQEEKDRQMKNIITRLITVEEELRKEQQEMQGVIIAKQKIIDAQERKILSLDTTNTKLLSALAQLKERCKLQGPNGTSSSPSSPAKLAVLENTDMCFKSSSC